MGAGRLGSARKGNRAEGKIAALVQEWWRRLEPKCEVVRTPKSGGWGTTALRADFRASGDLMVTRAKRFPFCVEVKWRERCAINFLIAGRPCTIWKWWAQTMAAAEELHAEPLLFCRNNDTPWRALLCARVNILDGRVKVPGTALCPPEGLSKNTPVLLFARDLFASDPRLWAVG